MAEARPRGYFGIGVEGVSKSANVGALLRTAHAFGAAFCFVVGPGWDSRAARLADTAETPAHVPLWRFPDVAALTLPQGCALVGVELLDTATDLPSFRHLLRTTNGGNSWVSENSGTMNYRLVPNRTAGRRYVRSQ